jgi:hypothetical protein
VRLVRWWTVVAQLCPDWAWMCALLKRSVVVDVAYEDLAREDGWTGLDWTGVS